MVFLAKGPFNFLCVPTPQNRSISLRTMSRLERQKVAERTSMPKRAANVAASLIPVEQKQVVVASLEALLVLLVTRVEAEAKEQTEQIGIVVEREV